MKRSEWELADVVNRFRDAFEQEYSLSTQQKGILTLLQQCHTPAMGGHVWHCPECGHEYISYNACRNRHCPKCNGLKRLRWIHARKAEAMPGGYAHMVFTLPSDLNDLCRRYPGHIYNLLFKAAWKTMEVFARDGKHLGARSGMVAVLHTWGQNLMLHPHIHCLVPMGGLTRQGKWKQARSKGKFLFPVKAMSKVFRGKFTDGLYSLDKKGKIKLSQSIDLEQKYLHPLYHRKWVVFAKRPVTGGEKAVEYIGKYAQRIAIANSRIKKVTDKKVAFSWIDYRHSKTHIMRLDGTEFLRRFVEHVLPVSFVKIRHYGILSNRLKKIAIDAAYQCQNQQRPEKLNAMPWFELIKLIYGKDPLLCPACKKARLCMVAVLPPKRASPVDNLTLNNDFYHVA
jgi:hypothetical protein